MIYIYFLDVPVYLLERSGGEENYSKQTAGEQRVNI